MSIDNLQNVEDPFLSHLCDNRTPVTVYLVSGVGLRGIITGFDDFSLLLRRDGQTQLLYKHAVSGVLPARGMDELMRAPYAPDYVVEAA
jgi:host factor-I protein